jgi:cell division septal protein FtsQ
VDSTANAQAVHTKAKERYRAGSRGFCWTCMMLVIVSAVFAAMMVYIKLTAMVGITGRRAPARMPAAPTHGRWRG